MTMATGGPWIDTKWGLGLGRTVRRYRQAVFIGMFCILVMLCIYLFLGDGWCCVGGVCGRCH